MMIGAFIKHKMYRDVCFRVLKYHNFDSVIKFKGEFWNLGCVDSYRMSISENVEIPVHDKQNWLYTHDYEGIPCLRYANWKELND